MPPWVDDADQTTVPVVVSYITRLMEMTFEELVPERTSPYSLSVPPITASAPSALPSAIASSFEGEVGFATLARTSPFATSPCGST